MANSYFVCSRNRKPAQFDISDERPADDAEIAYFIRVFQILEGRYLLDGFTVCFAWGSNIPLPRVGPDVIAVIYGDEHCRVPAYAGAVAAVFKCHGFFPNYLPRMAPFRLMLAELAEFCRNFALWVPTGWRWALPGIRARCHLLPLGYGFRPRVSPRPFRERAFVTSFQGSNPVASGRLSLRSLIGTPKHLARSSAIRALQVFKKQRDPETVPLILTNSFQASMLDAGKSYFDTMGQTKICVAPRGTAHETLRLYEGLMLGCVVVADRLPRHSFYRRSPIQELADWRTLPALLNSLLADSELLQDLHVRSLRYWHDVLSEEAVAKRCAKALGLVVALA